MAVVDTVQSGLIAGSTSLSEFSRTHHDGIIALSIFAGLLIAFCGRVILRPTVFLLGFAPTFSVFATIGLALVEDTRPQHTPLLEGFVVCLALLLGCIVGLVLVRALFSVATIVICAGLGVVLALDLCLLAMPVRLPPNAQVLRDLTVILAAVLAGTASVKFPETSVIFGTAFDGTAIAVFCLAKFMGHRPLVFASGLLPADAADVAVWQSWKVFYAGLVLGLGAFAAGMQLRLARAEARADRQPVIAGYRPVADIESGVADNDANLPSPEPPRTPVSFSNEEDAFANYGAMEHEYSVVSNLGAPPLASNGDGNAGANDATVKRSSPI